MPKRKPSHQKSSILIVLLGTYTVKGQGPPFQISKKNNTKWKKNINVSWLARWYELVKDIMHFNLKVWCLCEFLSTFGYKNEQFLKRKKNQNRAGSLPVDHRSALWGPPDNGWFKVMLQLYENKEGFFILDVVTRCNQLMFLTRFDKSLLLLDSAVCAWQSNCKVTMQLHYETR